MKIGVFTVTVLLLVTMLFTGFAHAADNMVTLDWRGLFMDAFSLEYERKISSDMSVGVEGLSWGMEVIEEDELITLRALGASVGVRKYLGGNVFEGIYVGAYGTGALVNVTSPQKATATSFGISGMIGQKWLLNEFAVDVGISVTVPFITTISAPEIDLHETSTFTGRGMGITLGIGYAW